MWIVNFCTALQFPPWVVVQLRMCALCLFDICTRQCVEVLTLPTAAGSWLPIDVYNHIRHVSKIDFSLDCACLSMSVLIAVSPIQFPSFRNEAGIFLSHFNKCIYCMKCSSNNECVLVPALILGQDYWCGHQNTAESLTIWNRTFSTVKNCKKTQHSKLHLLIFKRIKDKNGLITNYC